MRYWILIILCILFPPLLIVFIVGALIGELSSSYKPYRPTGQEEDWPEDD